MKKSSHQRDFENIWEIPQLVENIEPTNTLFCTDIFCIYEAEGQGPVRPSVFSKYRINYFLGGSDENRKNKKVRFFLQKVTRTDILIQYVFRIPPLT